MYKVQNALLVSVNPDDVDHLTEASGMLLHLKAIKNGLSQMAVWDRPICSD